MRILILGGDERQRKLKGIFASEDYDVQCITEPDQVDLLDSALLKAQAVLLPLPVSRDGKLVYSDRSELQIPLSRVIDGLDESKMLFAGIIRDDLKVRLIERNIPYFDYYTDEAFKSRNAFLTAQCALRLMLSETDEYIVGKRALVTGFGRVGKATAGILGRVGLEVYYFDIEHLLDCLLQAVVLCAATGKRYAIRRARFLCHYEASLCNGHLDTCRNLVHRLALTHERDNLGLCKHRALCGDGDNVLCFERELGEVAE